MHRGICMLYFNKNATNEQQLRQLVPSVPLYTTQKTQNSQFLLQLSPSKTSCVKDIAFLLFQCLLQPNLVISKRTMRTTIFINIISIKKCLPRWKKELLFWALWKLLYLLKEKKKNSSDFFPQHYPSSMTCCLLLLLMVKRSPPTHLNWPPSLSPQRIDEISKEIMRLTLLSNTDLLDVVNNTHNTHTDRPDF